MQPKSKWVIVAFVLFTLLGYGVKYDFLPIADLSIVKPIYYLAFGLSMFFGFKYIDYSPLPRVKKLVAMFWGAVRIGMPTGSAMSLLQHYLGQDLAIKISLIYLLPLSILCFYIVRKELKRKAST